MAEKYSTDTDLLMKDVSVFYRFYKDHMPIGKGGFGIVFQAAEKLSDRRVAIKRVKLRTGTEKAVLEELKILATLEHDHILRYYHSWSEPSEYHRERDKILFDQSEFGRFLTSTMREYRTRLGSIVSELSARRADSGGIFIFEPSQKEKSSTLKVPKLFNVDVSSSSDREGQKISEPNEYLFIVTSLCNKMTLADRLLPEYRSENKISRFDALHIFNQIVEGVRYLHDKMNLIHCDLKPANILFSLDVANTVKIADFGLALTQEALLPEEEDDNTSTIQKIGTTVYMSPSKEPVSFKRDIYALGIILFELLYPFSTGTERTEALDRLRQPNIEFPDDFEEKCGNTILKSLVTQLLSHSPSQRPTISHLKNHIELCLKLGDSDENEDAVVSKIEYVLANPSVKQLSLTTDEIQFGIFDTSHQYILLTDGDRLKLYDIDCQLIDEYSGLHESNESVGNIQRIVWCECLEQFLILCQYYLYAFTPGGNTKLTNMNQIRYIDKYCSEENFRHISCTNKYAFINYSYHTIIQYHIPNWSHSREWTRNKLNFNDDDEIHRITCSATNDYIAANIRLHKCQWVVDIRRIDNNLTLLKRIEEPDGSIRQKIQLSAYEWLISTETHHFCVFNCLKEDSNLKTVRNNIKSESFIYPRFFGDYFLVPVIEKQHNNDSIVQRRGIIHFYQWK